VIAAGEILNFWIWLAVLVVSVGAGAFYAGIETGIYVLNKIRLDLAAESGDRGARILRRQLDRPDNLLTVLLLGTNISGYAATFAITSMFVIAGHARSAEWLTLAVATPVLFVLRESVPKNVFHRVSEHVVYRLAWLLEASSVMFNAIGLAPFVRLFAWVFLRLMGSQQSSGAGSTLLARLVAEGHASGVLTQAQTTMAGRVMKLADVTLRDAMVPMSRAVCIAQAARRDDALEVIRKHRFSRFPVVNRHGKVIGILDFYDLLSDEHRQTPAQVANPPTRLRGDATITDALYQMQKSKAVMAVVCDRTDRDVGIVTVKDLVEQIVGQLQEW